VIEILLEAERNVAAGRLDQAERLYGQALEADPRNSIAVVGLARVAVERGDDRQAHELAARALEIDPENVAARRLATRLEEVLAARGERVPPAPAVEPASVPQPPRGREATIAPDSPPTSRRPGLIGRLLRRR
jgi:thioredoxin-like negative regulator of GroEL